jgi:hypothetical protein
LAAIPKSTIQTDPQSALGMASLFFIQGSEECFGGLNQRRIGQIALRRRGYSAKNFHGRLLLLGLRQGIERIQQLLDGAGHGKHLDWIFTPRS